MTHVFSNIPRQKLAEIVSQNGVSLCDDPRRLEALLRDLCGEHHTEINVLVEALKEQVPSALMSSPSGLSQDILSAQLARRLEDNLGLSPDAASWAVASWLVAIRAALSRQPGTNSANSLVSPRAYLRPHPQSPLDSRLQSEVPPPSTPADAVSSSVAYTQLGNRVDSDGGDSFLTVAVLVLAILVISALVPAAVSLINDDHLDAVSSYPTYREGQYIVISPVEYWVSQPQRGDYVLLRNPQNPGERLISRVIGLPNEEVELRSGQVFVDGQSLVEPYIQQSTRSTDSLPRTILQPATYFVLNDNRKTGQDSRDFGVVPRDYVEGKVWLAY